ncbi:MAG: DNA alkylation repair protein [Dysgonomonas sp.]
MTVEETIKDIRIGCRRFMNGVTSTGMRKMGADYGMNFGVSVPQMKDLAGKYQPNKDLAEKLWAEDTRELKILATLLYPLQDFDKERAEAWVADVPNQEIREQLCLNLLQNLDFAFPLSLDAANSKSESVRATGYWLLARLIISGAVDNIDMDKLNYLWNDLLSENVSLRNASILLLKRVGRLSQILSVEILKKTEPFRNSADAVKREIYDSLSFEFEFYHNNI